MDFIPNEIKSEGMVKIRIEAVLFWRTYDI